MRKDVPGQQREGFDALRAYLSEMAATAGDLAHTRKALFDAYVSEGFTPDQALRLVVAPLFGGAAA